jgi:hypothetical protein
MVFAVRYKLDIAQQHDLIISRNLFKRALQKFLGIFAVAGEPFLVGPSDPTRRLLKPFAIRVVTSPSD